LLYGPALGGDVDDDLQGAEESGLDCGGACGPCCALYVSDQGGSPYDVVDTGLQCWLQQNLRTTRFWGFMTNRGYIVEFEPSGP
jgi:hypothetical protein